MKTFFKSLTAKTDNGDKPPSFWMSRPKGLLLLFILSKVLFAAIFFLFFSFQKTGGEALEKNPPPEENPAFEEEFLLLEGNTLLASSGFFEPEAQIVKKMTVVVTAYSSTPWETWGNPYLTASETWVRDGIIANNLLPFGTKVRMPEIYGDKVFIVEDRMHSRKGHYHFDVWFPSYWEAKEFGVRRTYIEVLEG